MNSIGVMFIVVGILLLMECMVKYMTGLRSPARIVWWNYDGSVYQTESIPIGTDPHEYATAAMRTDSKKNEYHVIEGSG